MAISFGQIEHCERMWTSSVGSVVFLHLSIVYAGALFIYMGASTFQDYWGELFSSTFLPIVARYWMFVGSVMVLSGLVGIYLSIGPVKSERTHKLHHKAMYFAMLMVFVSLGLTFVMWWWLNENNRYELGKSYEELYYTGAWPFYPLSDKTRENIATVYEKRVCPALVDFACSEHSTLSMVTKMLPMVHDYLNNPYLIASIQRYGLRKICLSDMRQDIKMKISSSDIGDSIMDGFCDDICSMNSSTSKSSSSWNSLASFVGYPIGMGSVRSCIAYVAPQFLQRKGINTYWYFYTGRAVFHNATKAYTNTSLRPYQVHIAGNSVNQGLSPIYIRDYILSPCTSMCVCMMISSAMLFLTLAYLGSRAKDASNGRRTS